jgi:hypothetical protein
MIVLPLIEETTGLVQKLRFHPRDVGTSNARARVPEYD